MQEHPARARRRKVKAPPVQPQLPGLRPPLQEGNSSDDLGEEKEAKRARSTSTTGRELEAFERDKLVGAPADPLLKMGLGKRVNPEEPFRRLNRVSLMTMLWGLIVFSNVKNECFLVCLFCFVSSVLLWKHYCNSGLEMFENIKQHHLVPHHSGLGLCVLHKPLGPDRHPCVDRAASGHLSTQGVRGKTTLTSTWRDREDVRDDYKKRQSLSTGWPVLWSTWRHMRKPQQKLIDVDAWCTAMMKRGLQTCQRVVFLFVLPQTLYRWIEEECYA